MSAYISGGSSVGAAGGVSCDGGTPYYQIDYNINDGGINYPSYSTSSSISFGVNEDTKIGYWVYAYCQGPSASSGAVGGNYASTVRGIDTPGAPGMAAYISGGTAVGYVSSGVGCAAGSVQYQVPYNVNDGGMNWPGYWNGSSMSVGAGEGNKYGFWGYAYCQGTYSSSASNGGNYASAVRGIDVPSAPGFLGPWTMHSTSIYTLSWSTNCQGGWVVGSWRSQSWSGSNYGPYGWWTGGSDTAGWTNSVGYTRNVYYWGKYYCQSSYTNSGWSGESGPYTVGVTTT
jgi:hypothetical protein